MNIRQIIFGYLPAFDTLLGLLTGRLLFAALALSILFLLIIPARKNLSPAIRSWLWALCLPALFIPFERSAVFIAQNLNLSPVTTGNMTLEMSRLVLSYTWHFIWLLGFILFLVKTMLERKNTMRLIKSDKLTTCAAYFYKGRSRIYLSPDFDQAYTPAEREMLLAHERQHVIQHDPLLYRFLQIMRCVFWFCPLLHKAVHLIRQDRELLCDERVTLRFSKREYGCLLLREAQKAPPSCAVAGVVSEVGGVYERVNACVTPFSANKNTAIIVTSIAAILFTTGFIGFASPIVNKPMDIRVFLVDDASFSHIEGAEEFVLFTDDGIALDQDRLYEHVVAAGLMPEQVLNVCVIEGERPTLTSCYTVSNGGVFKISELKSEKILFSYYDAGFNIWGMLYKVL